MCSFYHQIISIGNYELNNVRFQTPLIFFFFFYHNRKDILDRSMYNILRSDRQMVPFDCNLLTSPAVQQSLGV